MTIKPEEIAALVEMFEASNWDELHVQIDGLHLFLSTDPDARLASGAAPAQVTTTATTEVSTPAPPVAAAPVAATAVPAQSRTEGAEPVPASWVAVTAPNLGTFYRAPKPGATPYVEVGQKVEESTELCLLEVMKLFTAVRSGVNGVVRRICVADAEMVEHGQILFYIEPA